MSKIRVIFFSGVHGSGKTTTIQKMKEHLESKGFEVREHPEFDKKKTSSGFNPGDPRFQIWYRENILLRERRALEGLVNYKGSKPLYIIFDRSAMDVEIYNMYYRSIGENKISNEMQIKLDHCRPSDYKTLSFMQHGYPEMFKRFDVKIVYLDESFEVLKERLVKRNVTETHREDWNETNDEYLRGVRDMFFEFYNPLAAQNKNIITNVKSSMDAEKILDILYN